MFSCGLLMRRTFVDKILCRHQSDNAKITDTIAVPSSLNSRANCSDKNKRRLTLQNERIRLESATRSKDYSQLHLSLVFSQCKLRKLAIYIPKIKSVALICASLLS